MYKPSVLIAPSSALAVIMWMLCQCVELLTQVLHSFKAWFQGISMLLVVIHDYEFEYHQQRALSSLTITTHKPLQSDSIFCYRFLGCPQEVYGNLTREATWNQDAILLFLLLVF